MKLKIELIGIDRFEKAIADATGQIVTAIYASKGLAKRVEEMRNESKCKSQKEPAKRKNYDDGTHGTRWIMRHYGISQRETTKAAKSLGIVNLGTGNNPRYHEADIKKIAGHIKDVRAIEILEQTTRLKDAIK